MLNLADLYRANGMDAQAAPLIEKAIQMSPLDPATFHAQGLLLVRQGKLDDAVALFPWTRQCFVDDRLNLQYSVCPQISYILAQGSPFFLSLL